MNFGGAFDALADDEVWMDAAMVAGGYLVPAVGGTALENAAGIDLPNELYGAAGIAVSEMAIGQPMVSVGSGLYTVDALSQRFGLKESVTSIGGGN